MPRSGPAVPIRVSPRGLRSFLVGLSMLTLVAGLALGAAPAGSAPKTLTPVPSAARAVPASKPPPPTGAMIAARGSDTCSMSSRQAVPWPRMVFTASYGGTKAAPVRVWTDWSVAALAGGVGSQNVISAPYERTASIFGWAEFEGCGAAVN